MVDPEAQQSRFMKVEVVKETGAKGGREVAGVLEVGVVLTGRPDRDEGTDQALLFAESPEQGDLVHAVISVSRSHGRGHVDRRAVRRFDPGAAHIEGPAPLGFLPVAILVLRVVG